MRKIVWYLLRNIFLKVLGEIFIMCLVYIYECLLNKSLLACLVMPILNTLVNVIYDSSCNIRNT